MAKSLTYESLQVARDEHGVATLTLDRPQAYNAFTAALVRALTAALEELERDDAVRAIVITGAGKAFCAGQALDDEETLPHGRPSDLREAVTQRFNPLIVKILTMEKPVVAAVNGVAAGAGLGLALACDFRVVSEDASFTTAFSKIGLVPDSGVSYLLPRLIGYAAALEAALLSDKMDAQTAAKLGLATEVVAADVLLAEAHSLAQRLAKGPYAYGLIKRQMVRNNLPELTSALAYEAELQGLAGASEDFAEGLDAFRNKRPPVFKGR